MLRRRVRKGIRSGGYRGTLGSLLLTNQKYTFLVVFIAVYQYMCIYRLKNGSRCSRNGILPPNSPRYCRRHFREIILGKAEKMMRGGKVILPDEIKDALIYIKNDKYYQEHKDTANWNLGTVNEELYLLTANKRLVAAEKGKPEEGTVKKYERFPPGLNNRDACCFMNAAVQFIYHIKPLRSFLIKHLKGYPTGKEGEYRRDTAQLLLRMQQDSRNTANKANNAPLNEDTVIYDGKTLDIIQDDLYGVFIGGATRGEHQDAFEFLLELYNKILPDPKEDGYDYITDMYEGNNLKEEYYYITGRVKEQNSIKYFGGKQCTSPPESSTQIVRLPLGKYKTTSDYMNYLVMEKDADSVCPTEIGDLESIGKCTGTKGNEIKACDYIEIPSDNRFITLTFSAFDGRSERFKESLTVSERIVLPGKTYLLSAIIVHRGKRRDGGHYFCLKLVNGKWYNFDDRKVSEVSDVANMSQYLKYDGTSSDLTPYVMLYEITG